MKILAMDIGAGTRDILLYDSEKQLENCVKMVLPSPSPLLAARVAALTKEGKDLYLYGHSMGGGSFAQAVKRHLEAGYRVYMTTAAAYSIRNNLGDVASMGIEITGGPPAGFSGATIKADELELSPLREMLLSVGEDLDTLDAVAVQDHGSYQSGESNRKTRLAYMRGKLEKDPDPLTLSCLAGEVPPIFPRMESAIARLREQLSCGLILVMDTAPAAVAGCLSDLRVAEKTGGDLLLVNAGNGHTMACITRGGRVAAIFEHHTRYLEPASFASYLAAFCRGEARDDDEFMASGHGLFYLEEPPGIEELDMIAVTGPNREILEGTGLDIYYPTPGGDMMMTGPMGLVRAVLHRI